MHYLTDELDIKEIILDFLEADILWLDTEVANYNTKNPQLSLLSILAYPENTDGSRTCIIDVLNRPDLVDFFVSQIMKNENITKVFHNAKYDLNFLGRNQAKKVICTLELARKIPYYLLPVQSYSLKNLTEYLTDFSYVSKAEQASNWEIRPLTKKQLEYAAMDPVYLAQIYEKLLQIEAKSNPDPQEDDLEYLSKKYLEIEHEWKLLDSQINHVKDRLKKAMLAQNKQKYGVFSVSKSERNTVKTDFMELVKLANTKDIKLDFMITLTKAIQNELGDSLNDINIQTDTTSVIRLNTTDTHE